jgi:putative DNA primase/helicase
MSPNNALVDVKLERMLVAALIRDPDLHDACGDLGYTDFGDPHAAHAYQAVANIRARGVAVTMTALREYLQDEHNLRGSPGGPVLTDRDLRWLLELAAVDVPLDPPVAMWAPAVVVLAETRRSAVADAEPTTPKPKTPPRGPRAENAEPVRLAEAFRRFTYERDGDATLVRWARAWWRYNGTRYTELDDELLDRDLIAFLDVVTAMTTVTNPKTGKQTIELRRVTSRKKTIGEVRTSLLHVMPAIDGSAPKWTSPEDGDPMIDNVLVCANGILDLRNRQIYPSTPRLFSTTAVGCAWDPEAPAPAAWLDFLASLWGEDRESVRALQQLFGYLLTVDTSYQKIFALIGPPRSGKGTIARVLRALLGEDAVVNPTLQSLERPFGLAPLVGKSLAIIGDARLGGHTDQQQVVERLLSISGEDALSIDRKNRDPINVRLRCRVLLLSNELPRLYDTSGALASRFVILTLSKSFLGNEDTSLEAKLLAELPGILSWAIEGYDDLAENGRFVQPVASEKATEHLRAISNPLGVFLEECCEIDPAGQCEVDMLYGRYKAWCESNGREPANKQVLGRDLNTLHPELGMSRPRRPDGTRPRIYEGIRCK